MTETKLRVELPTPQRGEHTSIFAASVARSSLAVAADPYRWRYLESKRRGWAPTSDEAVGPCSRVVLRRRLHPSRSFADVDNFAVKSLLVVILSLRYFR